MVKKLLQFIFKGLWEIWCIISIAGIWPRYLEPKILKTSRLKIIQHHLPTSLSGFKILHFSDLHFSKKTSQKFLDKLSRRILKEHPNVIVFTGDFICYSALQDSERLLNFLNSLKATFGCYCTFGNHDYAGYVTETLEGEIDVAKESPPFKALRRFLRRAKKPFSISPAVKHIDHHPELINLLKKTSFKILENETTVIAKSGAFSLKLTGLGDLWLDRCKPDLAFSDDASTAASHPHFAITLTHNPETVSLLKNKNTHLVLAGHTHGEQICFPGFLRKISKKMSGVTHLNYTRGLYELDDKKLYVTRGVGCHKVFRWGSIPEIVVVTLHHG